MRKIMFATAAAIALAAQPAAATNGLRMIGFSPVQNEMGGASVGLPLDSATMMSNPAGLSELKARADFGVQFFGGVVKYDAVGTPTGLGDLQVQYPGKQFTSNTRGGAPLPAIGLVIPITDNLTMGTGMFTIAGLGTDWPENIGYRTAYSFYLAFRSPFAYAYRVNDWLSLGASANLNFQITEFSILQFLNTGVVDIQQAHMSSTSLGLSGTVGAYFKPTKSLSIGLSYETPTWGQKMRYNVAANPDGYPPTNPTGPVPSPAVDYMDFQPPMVATLGFGYRPLEGVALAADLEWINWSGVFGKNKPKVTTDIGTQQNNLSWKDQWVVKVGTQLDVIPDFLNVRLGWDYGKNPTDPGKPIQNIIFATICEHHFTAGMTVQMTDKLAYTLGGMYAPFVKTSGSAPGFPPSGGGTNPDGEGINSYHLQTSMWEADVGMSYAF